MTLVIIAFATAIVILGILVLGLSRRMDSQEERIEKLEQRTNIISPGFKKL